MRRILVCFFFCFPFLLAAQVKSAYTIFNHDGKRISYQKMIKALSETDVVFFGELHNNTLAHWLELQLLKDLYDSNGNLTVGLEMFEADDQVVLDEYLQGIIEEKTFIKEAKVWDNYKTDYKPLIEFARKLKVPVIATNVPRRYANLVYRKGIQSLDSLSPAIKQWIAPLPLVVDYSLSGYKSMLEGMGEHGGGSARNLVASQALKDATMASFIARHQTKGNLFYHVNGAYHSQDNQGILNYLRQLKPELKISTVHVTEQADIEKLEESTFNKADFIICIVNDMIKSY
ncbi:MAG TPA: ChaN family lipoprotein [Ohtaekwangia sp.]|nr:ChaN family lipoprotein [Ohtaekwangia sp.]